MEELQKAKSHKLIINNRKNGMVTGVLDVLSFDLNEIVLETEQGMLMIKGTDLHVNRLSVEKGEVELSGNIDSAVYSNVNHAPSASGESFFNRLFK
ncbi:MAG: sporulation protein YabP [Ruminococcus sp.]|nr:sporulation protein YabP [Ruminococcus sp.]